MRPSSSILALAAACSLAEAAPIQPSNPSASAAARQLYAYLQNLSGQGILSGQLSMLNEATDDTTFRERYQMARNGGRMPAIYASNLGDWPMNYQDSIVRTIEHKWAKSGGQLVVMLCWHAVQPDTPQNLGYKAMSRFSASSPYPADRIDSILKPGTALHREWMHRLDTAASYLKRLDSAGIPVIWRPFHENNGAFFWWGQQPRFKELWRQMYSYYTDSLHLDNLLWAYSMCGFGEGDRWIDSLYPGHAYVDVLGADIDAASDQDFSPWIYQTLLTKAEGRPIGITENGRMPDVPVLKSTQPKWAFFCTWWGYEVDTMWANENYHPAGYSIQNPDALYKAVYGDPYTITRDRIDFGLAASSRVFLSTGISPAGGGRVVVSPDSGGRYSLGQNLSLRAVPTPGWVFTGWKGDVASGDNPLSVTLGKDVSVLAGFAALPGTNLLLNGNFDDSLQGWSFSAWESGAAASATVEGTDSVLRMDVTATGADPWGVQLTQGIKLDSGATYDFSFDVRGGDGAKLTCAVGEASGKYRKLFSRDDTLRGASFRTVGGSFLDTLPSSSTLRVEFSVGAQRGSLFVDNVKIAMRDAPAGVSRIRKDPAGLRLRRGTASLEWKLGEASPDAVQVRVAGLDGRLVAMAWFPAGSASGRLEGIPRSGPLVVSVRRGTRTNGAILPP